MLQRGKQVLEVEQCGRNKLKTVQPALGFEIYMATTLQLHAHGISQSCWLLGSCEHRLCVAESFQPGLFLWCHYLVLHGEESVSPATAWNCHNSNLQCGPGDTKSCHIQSSHSQVSLSGVGVTHPLPTSITWCKRQGGHKTGPRTTKDHS